MLLTDALLLDYKRCQRRAFLNRYGDPSQQDPERDFFIKLRQESQNHIAKVLSELYPHAQRLPDIFPWKERAEATETLMAQGVECIHKGVLFHETQDFLTQETITLVGKPHLLVKSIGQSKFGNWMYIPISIQLGRRPKPEYKILAAYYAYLLDFIQGTLPPNAQLILRPLKTYEVELEIWMPKVLDAITECLQMLHQRQEPEVFISRQRCSLCHWYTHCYTLAQSQQHLSLVPGVTPSRYESLQTLGVDSVASLANTSVLHVGELIGLEVATQLQQQAQSILENRAIRRANSPPNKQIIIPTASIELYFDIEAEPELNVDYLLGILLVNRQENTQQFYPFLAEQPEEEKSIWLSFVTFMNHYPEAPIFHYSEYEVETIKRLANLYGTPQKQLENLLSRCTDLHKQVINSVTFPVESYSLKSLANWLGFQWRDAGISGDQCVCWYDQWLTTGDRSLLDAILRYNEDDCWATFHLKNWLVQFLLNPLSSELT
ncbi:TM0106 family RecB-like putative nuclease [Gloeothece verrucosa]|uniref:RecB family nuclease, putative n=1 Tax=Gloeothece verrucosa (strain PCC 7822) TaxID=497965 RepID=E0U581_GLOV7|nr:TM0106 family RecB-like putative nuclease [Gloeothece verrucosa]ADN12360.1 RecB family nuclease, putative [Gloeothece verrucosa PCC 7822]